MTVISRRAALGGGVSSAVAFALGGCVSGAPTAGGPAASSVAAAAEPVAFEPSGAYAQMYGPVADRFPIPAAPLSRINPAFLRAPVAYASAEAPGTIVIEPRARYLYYVLGAAARCGTASAWGARASPGREAPRSTASRNGPTGIRRRR
jgi:lipoprotein-anchoring transpeptidase ErfK/SrfK